MPAIVIKAFNGIKPIVNQFLLQPGEAIVAENARLISGALVPLKLTTVLQALHVTDPQTIYRFGKSNSEKEFWLEFANATDVVSSPIPDDAYDRVYWTDGSTPKYAPSSMAIAGSTGYPAASLTLGVPEPVGSMSVSQSAYASASATITGTQITTLFVGDILSVLVDQNTAATVTLTGSGGKVTAATLAQNLSTVAGLTAVVSGTDVKASTSSTTATSALKISKKTGDTNDYSSDKVTYSPLIGPITGATASGVDSKATYTADASLIASIAPNARLAVKVNTNADVLVTVLAGTGTFPAAVTATSLRSALSVNGLNVSVNDTTSQSLTIETALAGTSASFTIRKVNPAIVPVYSELVSASNTSTAADNETRSYVYTYVTQYGEEGPPCKPSSLVTVNPNAAVSLSGMLAAPTGNYNIKTKRIYRTSATGTAAAFQYVDEIPVATATYSDTKKQAELGEVLLTSTWTPPPVGMKGLKMMANGVAVGFNDNTLYLSEPNMPHAWPHKYPVDYEIIGLSPFRQSVAILTSGHPFLASGADPAAMSLERLEFPHACLSKNSIVETGDGCLYAGADGVVSIGAGGMKIVSDSLFSREQWQALNPATMRAFFHDSRYHVMYEDKNKVRGTLIFDFSGQGAMLTTSTTNTGNKVTAGYSDPRTDTLYLSQLGSIVRFNSADTAAVARWKSGVYRTVHPVSFSFGMVRASSYPVGTPIKLTIYADAYTPFVKTVTGPDAFRLPAGFRAQHWTVEVESGVEVTMIALATSAQELQGIT